jgi:hypothetical protein
MLLLQLCKSKQKPNCIIALLLLMVYPNPSSRAMKGLSSKVFYFNSERFNLVFTIFSGSDLISDKNIHINPSYFHKNELIFDSFIHDIKLVFGFLFSN